MLAALFGFTALAAVACAGSGGGGGGDFEIITYQTGGVLDGRETTLQAVLDQGKPVVLNFWAGLCPPCRAEMPDLEAAWQAHRDDVTLLGIDIGPFTRLGTFNDGQALLREIGVTYPAGNTNDGSVLGDWRINGMPSTYFVLPDGTILSEWHGAIRPARLNARINDLIEAAQAG